MLRLIHKCMYNMYFKQSRPISTKREKLWLFQKPWARKLSRLTFQLRADKAAHFSFGVRITTPYFSAMRLISTDFERLVKFYVNLIYLSKPQYSLALHCHNDVGWVCFQESENNEIKIWNSADCIFLVLNFLRFVRGWYSRIMRLKCGVWVICSWILTSKLSLWHTSSATECTP